MFIGTESRRVGEDVAAEQCPPCTNCRRKRDFEEHALPVAGRGQAKCKLLPDGNSGLEIWTARDNFAAVVETAAMNEFELGE